MVICARIDRASTDETTYLRFSDWQELLNYMKTRYHRWVINFRPHQLIRMRMEENLSKCDEYVYLILYDDYIE